MFTEERSDTVKERIVIYPENQTRTYPQDGILFLPITLTFTFLY